MLTCFINLPYQQSYFGSWAQAHNNMWDSTRSLRQTVYIYC